MKKLLTIILSVLTMAVSSQVSYEQSASGLNVPELDGGRTELEFADINQDGHVDILFIGDHGSPYINTNQHGIMVWFGDGTGNFSSEMNGNFGYGGIAIGDVNNDGHLDAGYGMHHNYSSNDLGDQLIEVALGDGTGTNWTPWDDGLATNGETWGMFGTDFADVDNDGDLDIGSISFGAGAGVHVYLNNMDGTWEQSFGFLNGNSDMLFDFGDLNNDGYMDFAVSHQYGSCYFGDGTGNFNLNDNGLPGGGSYGRSGTSIGDVNNDGAMDFAFVGSNGEPQVWYFNTEVQQWSDLSRNLPSSGNFDLTQLWDMDVDGNTDLVAFGNALGKVWLGDGNGEWTEVAQFTVPDNGNGEALRVGGDIDNNGKPEIILVAEENEGWWQYQNKMYCFVETTAASQLSVTPVYPKGNEIILAGGIRNIRWAAAVPGNESANVSLEYSVNGASGPWNTIAEETPNNGCYQWPIPDENSTDCYIRYTINTGGSPATAITPASFNIAGGSSSQQQTTDLNEGFQFVSSYINPDEPDMMIVLSGLIDESLDFVRNSEGEVLQKIGPEWINNIGDWQTTEGYLFKMTADDELTLSGDLIDPLTPIQLGAGYQFVSYLPEESIDALAAFENIIGDDLEFIRNSSGEVLQKIGDNWVNNIGMCNPGEGYLIRMNGDAELIYNVPVGD
ncbi:MAG: VCBS repeat-containing protein [Bacteroidales bacterium]|nr:VCBS repeat-containing protein [Bacteroidales bacterium]